jgi:hypothetical protein
MKMHWKQITTTKLDFINECLDMGPLLSQRVKNKLGEHIIVKKMSALCEYGTPIEKLLNFKEGSLFSQKVIKEDLLENYLRAQNESIFIFEDFCLDRNSLGPLYEGLALIFQNQNVYLYYNSKKNNIPLGTYINYGGWFPFICYIIKDIPQTRIINFPHELTEQELDNIICKIKEIIIGAYDEESYIKISLAHLEKEFCRRHK